jgi:aminodeoxyfutalosine deaminase
MRLDAGDRISFHRAKWVMVTPSHIVEDAVVEVRNGVVAGVQRARVGSPPARGSIRDHGEGVIMSGLVNGHTHLELSALQGRTGPGKGMIGWVKSLLKARDELKPERLEEGLREGVERMTDSGAVLVGDVCNRPETVSTLDTAPFYSWSFREYLGAAPDEGPGDLRAFDESGGSPGRGVSLAGHAPHTTGGESLRRLKRWASAKNLPFSIHLAESPEEVEFLRTGRGGWADFLDERGLTLDSVQTGPTPTAYAETLGILDTLTLAVHLTMAGREDLERIARHGVHVCVCPRSNYSITGKLPPLREMIELSLAPALGTDSLASAPSLSLWDEMAFTAARFPDIDPRIILEMATVNGARALGLGGVLGDLLPGRYAAMVYVSVQAKDKRMLAEELVHGGGGPSVECLERA